MKTTAELNEALASGKMGDPPNPLFRSNNQLYARTDMLGIEQDADGRVTIRGFYKGSPIFTRDIGVVALNRGDAIWIEDIEARWIVNITPA